ncbi:MAG: DUF255 domain-containing protein [Rhodobacteraceae bacterium]|nr:DUF255 domain-containing protein [Paracoccaceae bacterium]
MILLVASVETLAAREGNTLRNALSPYLLQHADNPVDWYPWGAAALHQARTQNKPIFVSVGYSSCHWCHVMRKESFEDARIAAFLNAHFISIKIDREARPDLDAQFQAVTALLGGAGGWPNSVFLTPAGDPYFAGGYFAPAPFLEVLQRVSDAWQDDPTFVSQEARKVTRALRAHLTRKAAATEVSGEAIQHAASDLLKDMDAFYGGYGTAPKFPREPLFLFLFDQAQRSGDTQLLHAVTDTLDGMVNGGIHDHVGGGFHRYAVDPEWHVPHFEKMLYTQAMTGRLLLRAYDATGQMRYRRASSRLFDYVLRDLRDPQGGFYSAQDADSLTPDGHFEEGAFYTWHPDDLHGLSPSDAAFLRNAFQITPDGPLDGASVLYRTHTLEELAQMEGTSLAETSARLDTLSNALLALRQTRPAPFLDRKIVLSWNALMIETLAEAATVLQRPDLYAAAETAATFLLNHMRTESGLKRIWFKDEASIDAQLADYAALGLAFLSLSDHGPDTTQTRLWRQRSYDLATEIRDKFGKATTGFRATQTKSGLTDHIPFEDTAIPSGNALALTLFARLAQRMPLPEIEQEGYALAAAMSGRAIGTPAAHAYALKALQDLINGGSGPLQFAAKGAVRARFAYDRDQNEVTADVTIAEGWHINAHAPLDDYLIGTNLRLADGTQSRVDYPEPQIKTLAFNDAPLALYEGRFRLRLRHPHVSEGQGSSTVRLTLQACNHDTCLQPETLEFVLW